MKTTLIPEIRGLAEATPLPLTHVLGSGICRFCHSGDRACCRDNQSHRSSHSAIVVVEVADGIIGPVVDQVSGILSINGDRIQPVRT
ncbi:chemotaxis signal transduction CheW-like protein (plasmid) [Rhizobium etli 8C-3]|uniref:Chemotaxis signal transduction CheW-like protein n=1 Tax=Rhizobium etli 8C-3 TaxID=538025 RepID=A0A1L5PBG8_RHIET|nr:chemotaxis signal transduction CheW-like protein [Rhizobium sp. N113]ANL49832.1 chemotaxis signal transduction CheW-like protein [Rhizobium phaseoli]APO77420.1 chemotaxis signal transduction CheW-like protein [Rhizobium etli 8C-3]ARO26765.1 chemotaxis signal transduction CheW-like protein [Rhizobium sp. TAL182]ARQ60641.1 chemotaxis signal transduction CheW-like protein [Rhizobium sp. Kim5]EGE59408.1 hypothetical protein RHECNPAF_22002 [Rhizobium etli CNPAF512]